MFNDFTDHPIKKLIDFNFPISINTDNRLMSNTNIKKESIIAKNLNIENVDKLLEVSASYSFLNNY